MTSRCLTLTSSPSLSKKRSRILGSDVSSKAMRACQPVQKGQPGEFLQEERCRSDDLDSRIDRGGTAPVRRQAALHELCDRGCRELKLDFDRRRRVVRLYKRVIRSLVLLWEGEAPAERKASVPGSAVASPSQDDRSRSRFWFHRQSRLRLPTQRAESNDRCRSFAIGSIEPRMVPFAEHPARLLRMGDDMLFNSFHFAYFFAALLPTYWLLKKHYRWQHLPPALRQATSSTRVGIPGSSPCSSSRR